jgi:hypothetical protein
MKKILVIIPIIFILFGLYVMYDKPKKTDVYIYVSTPAEDSMAWLENEILVSEDAIPEQYRDNKEWIPVKVSECVKKDDGKFEITFINDYHTISDTPAKIGDTNRCWINTWYYSKEYPTADSIIFENPYKK